MSLFVILRHGCLECGEPVDLVGCFTDLEAARQRARDMLAEGQDWRWVELQVWRCGDDGTCVEMVDVQYVEWKNEVVESVLA